MITFTPKTEQDIKTGGYLIPEGVYDFEVISAENTPSKKDGTPMIKLKLKVFYKDREQWVFDYLHPALEFKIKHFCDSCGLQEKYQSGKLTAEDCSRRAGRVYVVVQEGKNGYSDSNKVKDYVDENASEDDVPF